MEGAVTAHVEHGADGDAAVVSTDHRHGRPSRSASPRGVAPGAGSLVLGVGGDHPAESSPERGGRESRTHGPGMDRLGRPRGIHSSMNAPEDFPRLTPANHRVTSPATID